MAFTDLAMMEMGAEFDKTLTAAGKTLSAPAKSAGAKWLRGRLNKTSKLRWNPIRTDALEATTAVAQDAVANSQSNEIQWAELAASLKKLGKPAGATVMLDDCPF